MIKKANKKVAVLNFVVLFILILVGLFVLSVPQFDLSSLSVASFYLYFPSVALLLVYCILYLCPYQKGAFRVGKDIKCLYGAYDCDDCYCCVCFSDCDILRQKRESRKRKIFKHFRYSILIWT